jgi:hypothetical protein
MKKITKKTLKRIKEGYHGDLMEAIEFLLDTYNEDKWNGGYQSCFQDMAVRSQRLAEHINNKYLNGAKKDDLSEIIIEYFNKALNKE